MRNCGDAISAYILDRVFDYEPVLARHDQIHLSAVGSIIEMADNNSYIWGSGLLRPNSQINVLDPQKICAVRGTLTRNLLHEYGLKLNDIPLGDPGILVDEVLALEKSTLPIRYHATIVPHHSAINQQEFKYYRNKEEFCVVNVMNNSLDPIRQIAMSEVVISQSLHGLIFAEALGKPSVWIAHTDDFAWCFKFHDWYSTTATPQTQPFPIETNIQKLLNHCRLSEHKINKVALKKAFPQQVLTQNQGANNLLPYQFCRSRRVAFIEINENLYLERIPEIIDNPKMRHELQWKIRQIFNQAFVNWSEPTYANLAPKNSGINPDDADATTDFLDRQLKYEYLFLAQPRKQDEFKSPRVFSSRGRKFAVIKNIKKYPIVGIVLRPHGWFSLNSPHITLVPLRASE